MDACRLFRLLVAASTLVLALFFSPLEFAEVAGQTVAPGSASALLIPQDITTPNPLLGDVQMRRALSHCTDKSALAQKGYTFLRAPSVADLLMDTFVPTDHQAYEQPPAGFSFGYDLDAAGELLDEIG